MKLSNARYLAGRFTCDSCSVQDLIGVFLHPFLFPGRSMIAYKCVFSLSAIFMSIPWKAGLCMKTEAAQCHRNAASLPPAARELRVGDHNLWVWWECHLRRYWQENGVAGELGVEWGLGDRWMLISSELSKLFRITVYPLGSVWL